MKKISIHIVKMLLAVMLVSLWSCEDFDNEIGPILDASELDYSVVQDYTIDEGGNTVILTNYTPQTIPVWDYGSGTSRRAVDTIRFAFAGTYTINFSAITEGGVVEGQPVTITVTENNFNYVSDPIWEMLTGGVGNTKTWLLDVDADGVSKYWNGPMFFFGADIGYLEEGGDWGDGVHTTGCYGDDCWTWDPDLPSIQGWGFSGPADFGEMTFGLVDGATLEVNHLTLPSYGQQSGNFYVNTTDKTLSTTNATILHDAIYETCVLDWNNAKILSITEDAMQIGIYRDCDPATLSFNFISKDYSDNWVPEETGPEEPTLPGNWEDIVSEITTTAITWKLSEDTPLNWTNLSGGFLNSWNSAADYPDWLGTPDPAVYGDFSMTTDSSDNSVVFVTPDGTTTEGTYALSSNGTYSFSVPVPSFPVISWANFYADANNELRIVNLQTDSNGNVTDMWLGAVDNITEPTQYSAFHLVPSSGGPGGGGNTGTTIPVDNSLIAYGDLETNGNVRIEIYNDFGGTSANPPIDTSSMVFNSLEVTFTISGTGVSGNYDASIFYATPSWNPSGNGAITNVTGDGTYTVTYAPGANADGCLVFVIDIVGMANDITDMSTVTATIDEIIIN